MARGRCELSGAARARNIGDLTARAGLSDLLGKSNQFRNQASTIKRLVGVNAVLCGKFVGSNP
jgi:hypothetical protein